MPAPAVVAVNISTRNQHDYDTHSGCGGDEDDRGPKCYVVSVQCWLLTISDIKQCGKTGRLQTSGPRPPIPSLKLPVPAPNATALSISSKATTLIRTKKT